MQSRQQHQGADVIGADREHLARGVDRSGGVIEVLTAGNAQKRRCEVRIDTECGAVCFQRFLIVVAIQQQIADDHVGGGIVGVALNRLLVNLERAGVKRGIVLRKIPGGIAGGPDFRRRQRRPADAVGGKHALGALTPVVGEAVDALDSRHRYLHVQARALRSRGDPLIGGQGFLVLAYRRQRVAEHPPGLRLRRGGDLGTSGLGRFRIAPRFEQGAGIGRFSLRLGGAAKHPCREDDCSRTHHSARLAR